MRLSACPLSAMCSGCHGARGVSIDTATPSLAGQDAQYLTKATKAYRTTRQNWGMQRYVANLSDKDIDNIVAFYASQPPKVGTQKRNATVAMTRTTLPPWRRRR